MPDTSTSTNNSTSPKDPRLIEAEIELAEANARKAAAEASAAEISAFLPDLPKEVAAGSLTTPETPAPIATVAAYRALGEVGRRIAAKLPGTGTVWIVPDGGFLKAIDNHDTLAPQLRRLDDLAKGAIREVSIGETDFGPATELVAAAVPLLMSLFSTSRTVTAAEVPIGFTAAAAAVVGAARPGVYVSGVTPPPAADLAGPVVALQGSRDALDKALVDARAKSAPTSIETSATAEAEAWKSVLVELAKKSDSESISELVDKVAAAVGRATDERNRNARLGQVLKSCEQLVQSIDAVLEKVTGSGALAAESAFGASLKESHVLVLQPTFTGAESIYEDVKLKRDRALHMGSTVITWYILEKSEHDHRSVAAGIEWASDSATTQVGLPQVTWAPSANATDQAMG